MIYHVSIDLYAYLTTVYEYKLINPNVYFVNLYYFHAYWNLIFWSWILLCLINWQYIKWFINNSVFCKHFGKTKHFRLPTRIVYSLIVSLKETYTTKLFGKETPFSDKRRVSERWLGFHIFIFNKLRGRWQWRKGWQSLVVWRGKKT